MSHAEPNGVAIECDERIELDNDVDWQTPARLITGWSLCFSQDEGERQSS